MIARGTGAFPHLAISTTVHRDRRGDFVKVLGDEIQLQLEARFRVAEIFWTRSDRNVVRGLHYQTPPASVEKLVWCSGGSAFDVIVDLRADSATFGTWDGFIISPANGGVIHVPHGFAHGFCSLEHDTVIGYAQSGPFDPACDAGIRWDSVDIDWPITVEPVMSDRDRTLPALADLPHAF